MKTKTSQTIGYVVEFVKQPGDPESIYPEILSKRIAESMVRSMRQMRMPASMRQVVISRRADRSYAAEVANVAEP